MQVIITGGAGFIGKRLARKLLEQGSLTAANGSQARIDQLVIADIAAPEPALPADPRLEVKIGDFSDMRALHDLITPATGAVFHLAAVVSGGAEEDFDLGMRVNLHASMHLLEACRRLGTCPKFVFASSVAVYGGAMPDIITDDLILTPQTSYGVQKAAVELLVNDYSRRGFIDGRSLRLPTIVVRPGKPNKALSGFASSIVREPLQGQEYACPVAEATEMWVMSPRRVVEAFVHAAQLPASAWGSSRAVALPGITVNMRDTVAALRTIAGDDVVQRIRWQPEARIEKIVNGWPRRFDPQRGLALGFKADHDIAEIIRAFIDDELGGKFVA